MAIEIKAVNRDPSLPLPSYQTEHSAGMDLFAAEEATLLPGQRAMIATGLSIALPDGFEAQVRPRSGLAAKHGVTLVNTPGTIDADYRGEIKVILINHGSEEFQEKKGERIAQMVIAKVTRESFVLVEKLPRRNGARAASALRGNSRPIPPGRERLTKRPSSRAAILSS